MSEFTTWYPIKHLGNDGKNYRTWAMRMELILQAEDLWDVVDPSTQGTAKPTAQGQELDDWLKKDKKAVTRIKCYIGDMALLFLRDKTHARDAWKALSDQYDGTVFLEATELSSRIYRFRMDGSKPLEPQIDAMCELRYQLASLGEEMRDGDFSIAVSQALPRSYDNVKSFTRATFTDTNFFTNALIMHILQEEKYRAEAAAMDTTSGKSNSRGHTAKSAVRCTNTRCGKLGHSFEQCWAEGGGRRVRGEKA